MHWFNFDRFYAEVKRVLTPHGLIAVWAYGINTVEGDAVNELVQRYYADTVGPYWPPERALIEKFEEIPFPFPELKTPEFEIAADWNLEHLMGYLRSWSSTQRFIAATNRNPLAQITEDLEDAWGEPQQIRRIVWPLVLRVGVKTASQPTKR